MAKRTPKPAPLTPPPDLHPKLVEFLDDVVVPAMLNRILAEDRAAAEKKAS